MRAVRHKLSYLRQVILRKRHHSKNKDNRGDVTDINAHNMDATGDFKQTFAQ